VGSCCPPIVERELLLAETFTLDKLAEHLSPLRDADLDLTPAVQLPWAVNVITFNNP